MALCDPDSLTGQHLRWSTTEHNPERRPATVDALLELIAQQLDYGQPDPGDTAGTLLAAASEGDATAAAQLSALAASHPDDARLYTEVLPAMPWDAVCAAVDADHHHADEVVQAALGHVREDLSWGDAARIITWLYWITARAGEDDDLTCSRKLCAPPWPGMLTGTSGRHETSSGDGWDGFVTTTPPQPPMLSASMAMPATSVSSLTTATPTSASAGPFGPHEPPR